MKKPLHIVLAAAFLIAGTMAAFAASPSISPGAKAPSFSLKDVGGKEHSLDQYMKSKYVVVMFIATQCPVSNDYNERMVKLYDQYAAKDISFLGINSNKQESVSEIKEHSAKHGFKFAVLKDVDNVVADAYGAQVTPEIYVIDPGGTVRYHGRIDDSRDADEIDSHDLSAALDALLAGKDPARTDTKAFGCSIKRIKKQS
jgi:peroxiredoxin